MFIVFASGFSSDKKRSFKDALSVLKNIKAAGVNKAFIQKYTNNTLKKEVLYEFKGGNWESVNQFIY